MDAGNSTSVIIIGPGAIGGFVASELVRHGISVKLLGRSPEAASQIGKHGIRVSGFGGKRVVRVPVSTDPSIATGASLVCVCVKAYQTETVAGQLRGKLTSGTVLVSLQNGLGNIEALQSTFVGCPMVAAVTSYGVTRLSPSRIHQSGEGLFEMAPVAPCAQAGTRAFAALLRRAGFNVRESRDAEAVRWRKVLINAAINPVAALAGVPNGALLQEPDLMRRALMAAEEVSAVARRLNIHLGASSPTERVQAVCQRTATNRCSMLQDLECKRRTEVDALNGAVVRQADRLGEPVPVNRELTAAIHAREREHTS